MKRFIVFGLLVLVAGCSGLAGMRFTNSFVPAATSHAVPAIVVGEYFSLADGDSDVKWVNRLTPSTPFDKLTRLYINGGWLYPDKTGKFTLQLQHPYMQARMQMLIAAARKQNPKAEIFIVSGYDADGDMYKAAVKNPKYYAGSVVAFLRANKLDGYDCDWENGILPGKLNTLATAVHKALTAAGKTDGKRYLFTMAVWPSPSGRGYNLPVLNTLVDQFGIMSYGVGDDLKSDAAQYVKGGISIGKLIGGVDTEIDYPTGVDTLGAAGTIAKKTQYARKNKLAGMMSWRLDNDYNVKDKPTYAGAKQLWAASI